MTAKSARSRKAKTASASQAKVLVVDTILKSVGIIESHDVVSILSEETHDLFLRLHEAILKLQSVDDVSRLKGIF